MPEELTSEQKKDRIAALIREARGYEIHGPKDRLEQVRDALKQLGHDAKPPAKRASTRKAA